VKFRIVAWLENKLTQRAWAPWTVLLNHEPTTLQRKQLTNAFNRRLR